MSSNVLTSHKGTNVIGLRTGAPELVDEQMEQIRELLFGEIRQQMSDRFAVIEQRLSTLEGRIQALSEQGAAERKDTLDQLSRGIGELGDYVKRIARP